MMSDFVRLLRADSVRRRLSDAEIATLASTDLEAEWWTPGKTMRALRVMQAALRQRENERLEPGADAQALLPNISI